MKLLKIGRDSSCNIKLHSSYVSSIHAEMLLLDNGEIYIEDKNSANGTFVDNQRINPNTEVLVRRGDLIRLGDTTLDWRNVPTIKPGNYKSIYNIGTALRNEINLSDIFSSRYHATLAIDKDKKAYIIDNGSKNGTLVNGQKITKERPFRIKRNDMVTCGKEDITEIIKPLIPAPLQWLKTTGIVAGIAAVLAGLGFLLYSLFGNSTNDPKVIRTGVVYVQSQSTLLAEIEDCPIDPDVWEDAFGKDYKYGCIPVANISSFGTAFFLDQDGNMATNRHVAEPWNNCSDEYRTYFMNQIEKMLHINELSTDPDLASAQKDEYDNSGNTNLAKYWELILMQAAKHGDMRISSINTIIRQLNKCNYKISGQVDYIAVGYPGRNYTHMDEYDRCFVRKVSDNKDIDLALLQLNKKKTPENVKFVFNPKDFKTDKLEPSQDILTWIGYPIGAALAMDPIAHVQEPEINQTACTKVPNNNIIEIKDIVEGGTSGSPVFDKKSGKLVGIIFSTLGITGTSEPNVSNHTFAVQAKYLQKLYQEEVQ